ncbi:ornithine cyclodeaminase family protein [Sporosarcina gallistercoris]|uniref:ornithine cyclodeaminase family protein n=1 Tax=Sporosarcina gallistercoris TaxID=2762245 RepID=UPI003D2A54EB
MLIINEHEIKNCYVMKDAIQDVRHILASMTAAKVENPHRTVIEFPLNSASVLYMPSADKVQEIASVKIVSIFPENPSQGKPTTQGTMLLTDTSDGSHLALMNASYLTRLRTGALSAIATDLLSKKNSKVLTVIGTGAMAFEQVLGILEVRAIQKIYLVNPTLKKAEAFKERLRSMNVEQEISIQPLEQKSTAIQLADIICCSTRSVTPVFDGDDIQPGTHVNGVGSYLPHMREVDFNFIERCSKIVVDDFAGIREEAGELIHANEQNSWSFDSIHGELKDVASGKISSRKNDDEITFFKCVGAAYFDLAVGNGVYKKAVRDKFGTTIDL